MCRKWKSCLEGYLYLNKKSSRTCGLSLVLETGRQEWVGPEHCALCWTVKLGWGGAPGIQALLPGVGGEAADSQSQSLLGCAWLSGGLTVGCEQLLLAGGIGAGRLLGCQLTVGWERGAAALPLSWIHNILSQSPSASQLSGSFPERQQVESSPNCSLWPVLLLGWCPWPDPPLTAPPASPHAPASPGYPLPILQSPTFPPSYTWFSLSETLTSSCGSFSFSLLWPSQGAILSRFGTHLHP